MCCSIDKDTPLKPVTKLKGASPRSKRQLQLMAAMVLLANATGSGRVFHTRAELQLKHKLRQFRACNGVLDTSRISGTALTALQTSKVATDNLFDTATNNSGGIQGGISNGEQIVIRVAFKPTATIRKEQQTINAAGSSASRLPHENP